MELKKVPQAFEKNIAREKCGLFVFVRKLDNLSELCSNKIKKLVSIKAVKQD